MPIAGIVFWLIVAVAALYLSPQHLAYLVGFGSGMIFPLGILIKFLPGRKIKRASSTIP